MTEETTRLSQTTSGFRRSQTFFDETTRETLVLNTEIPFPTGELLISITDPHGIIVSCNESLLAISAYELTELVGQPHHILRHPDMPRVTFRDLWATISQGNKWNGYIKNLRKDGAFYWVYSSIQPNIRGDTIVGYTSVQREPYRQKIEKSAQIYKQLLSEEHKPS